VNGINAHMTQPTTSAAPNAGKGRKIDPEELRAYQFAHLIRQVPMMTTVSIVSALTVSIVLGGLVPLPTMALWAAAIILPSLCSLFRALAGRRRGEHMAAERHVGRRTMSVAVAWSGYMGLLWGGAALLFLLDAQPGEILFLVFVIGGMMAGMVATLSPLPMHLAAFGAGAAPPTLATLLLGESMIELGMAVLFAVFCAGLGVAAWNAYHRFVEMLAVKRDLSATTELLRDAIESTGEAFAVFSPEGHRLISNRQFHQFFPDGRRPQESRDPNVLQLLDGRWVKRSQRQTQAGGTVDVYADITDLKEQEAALDAARLEAEGANRAKSQFLAVMSHELRTPLNGIIGFAELLAQDEFEHRPEVVREYGGLIAQSGRHLLSLITDILDLSRIEAGRYSLVEEELEFDHLVEEVTSAFQPLIATGKLTIELDLACGRTVLADARAVRQMLDNLLSNAVKFTEAGGRILVRTARCDRGVALSVEDTGIGIPEDALEMIFEPFRQVDERLARARDGTGLGLPLVRRLVELHGGAVEVASKPGQGSRFVLRFPAHRVLAANKTARQSA